MNSEPELRLLLQEQPALEQPDRRVAMVAGLAAQVVLVFVSQFMPANNFVARSGPRIDSEIVKVTPLIAPPPKEMTQKDPSKGKVSLEVNLEGLVSKSTTPRPPTQQNAGVGAPQASRNVEAPAAAAVAPPKTTPEPSKPEPEQVVRNSPPSPQPPAQGVLDAPQPRIQVAEQPRLPVPTSGTAAGTGTGTAPSGARIPPISRPSSIEEMARQATRPSSSGGGLVVGGFEESSPGLGSALSGNQPLRQGSSLELLSDPKGVDFKPYMIRVLASVKKNWLAVMPESARLGQRGQTQIQFAVNRDGSVPKLVIASPSGTQSFDRAAVAGVSASNPFPPLPSEFQGLQIRLQLTFTYNAPPK